MEEINGFYDDDGTRINLELIRKPGLCLLCCKNDIDDPLENILCTMTRHDQRNKGDEEFECGAFEKK